MVKVICLADCDLPADIHVGTKAVDGFWPGSEPIQRNAVFRYSDGGETTPISGGTTILDMEDDR